MELEAIAGITIRRISVTSSITFPQVRKFSRYIFPSKSVAAAILNVFFLISSVYTVLRDP